jgi:hypothetical protein
MNCPYCHRPLIKIDYYGEVLVGCVECNLWGKSGDENFVLELMEKDLEALRATHQDDRARKTLCRELLGEHSTH